MGSSHKKQRLLYICPALESDVSVCLPNSAHHGLFFLVVFSIVSAEGKQGLPFLLLLSLLFLFFPKKLNKTDGLMERDWVGVRKGWKTVLVPTWIPRKLPTLEKLVVIICFHVGFAFRHMVVTVGRRKDRR